MRTTVLALALAAVGGFTLANCGSGSNMTADMGKDMAQPPAPPDMAIPKLNCLGIGNCILQCVIAQQGDLATCATNICMKQAKVGSYNKWVNAFLCGQEYCAPTTDMLGKCVTLTNPADPNQSSLCDPSQTYAQCTDPNAPETNCTKCIANARNLILGDFSVDPPGSPTGMCPDPTSPDCKGGAMCMTLMNACIADQ